MLFEADVLVVGYREWFATLGSDTVLVRPDFYLFGTGCASTLIEALDAAIACQRE